MAGLKLISTATGDGSPARTAPDSWITWMEFSEESSDQANSTASCSTIRPITPAIVPNAAQSLSDEVVGVIRNYKGRLILAGNENGLNDEDYRQRAELPFTGETIPLPAHQIVKLNWKIELRFQPDGWDELLRQEISFELHPAAHPVVKMKDGKVAAVLISAPCSVPGGEIKVPLSMQKSGYKLFTLNGPRNVTFDGETLRLPGFEGALALISR